MSIRILECHAVSPGEDCSFVAIGQEEEIEQSLVDHLERFHPDPSRELTQDYLRQRMLRAVYVSGPRAYVGDDVDVDENSINLRGGGYVLQSFGDSAAVSLECACQFGEPGATCRIQLSGTTANCIKDTCLQCGWSTTIPAGIGPGDAIFLPPE